jgi:hypothetical protein
MVFIPVNLPHNGVMVLKLFYIKTVHIPFITRILVRLFNGPKMDIANVYLVYKSDQVKLYYQCHNRLTNANWCSKNGGENEKSIGRHLKRKKKTPKHCGGIVGSVVPNISYCAESRYFVICICASLVAHTLIATSY